MVWLASRKNPVAEAAPPSITLRAYLSEPPDQVFPELVRAFASALGRARLQWETGPEGQLHPLSASGDPAATARTVVWAPGREIKIEWPALEWAGGQRAVVDLRLAPLGDGTELTVDWSGWSTYLQERGPGEFAAWVAGEVASSMLTASATDRFADWLIDRTARRPSGSTSIANYRDPIYHRPNFLAILEALQLTSKDRLVEVGCGGGAFLKDALATGLTASAIDHSPDLLEAAREQNREAIDRGRLTLVEGDARALPFLSGTFTVAVMTGVLHFVPDPGQAFAEMHRVLSTGGRMAVFTGSAALKGTPAAPEPHASRLRFFTDDELVTLARRAGFVEARVEHPAMYRYAVQVGIPTEALPLFEDSKLGGQLLLARK